MLTAKALDELMGLVTSTTRDLNAFADRHEVSSPAVAGLALVAGRQLAKLWANVSDVHRGLAVDGESSPPAVPVRAVDVKVAPLAPPKRKAPPAKASPAPAPILPTESAIPVVQAPSSDEMAKFDHLPHPTRAYAAVELRALLGAGMDFAAAFAAAEAKALELAERTRALDAEDADAGEVDPLDLVPDVTPPQG